MDNSTEDVENIKKVIIEAGKKSEACGNNTTWTYNLNKAFINFSHDKGFAIYSKTRGSNWTEWLYDITICKQTKENIDETYLVVESEWSIYGDEIWYDFQKLLLCNSKYKAMVFIRKTEEDWKKMIVDMKQQIKLYKTCNGVFILACFVDYNNGYEFETVNCSNN